MVYFSGRSILLGIHQFWQPNSTTNNIDNTTSAQLRDHILGLIFAWHHTSIHHLFVRKRRFPASSGASHPEEKNTQGCCSSARVQKNIDFLRHDILTFYVNKQRCGKCNKKGALPDTEVLLSSHATKKSKGSASWDWTWPIYHNKIPSPMAHPNKRTTWKPVVQS